MRHIEKVWNSIEPPNRLRFRPMLAHQGGWDEILLVAGPIVVIVGLLALANKRAKRLQDQRQESEDPS